MPKFYDKVGYSTGSVESPVGSGVWVGNIVEKAYYGDISKQTRNLEPGEPINSDISVSNTISIVADAYAFENFMNIKYIWWNGVVWTVTSVDVRPPRLVLSLGQVYNGPIFVEEEE
ncbi:hypothetical protein KC614_03735 [candidate division WWE3 bacterium]|uniref:DUF7253 domain-containing protein n=1 Tax=candidate division WWE3 bacterium TaxID=2053526 RepID=A0A955LL62_UNCKA|nr:hypothetical protein [candidate division WWE3 bacterium]